MGGEEGIGGSDGQVMDAGNDGTDGLEHNCLILRQRGIELRDAGVGNGGGEEIPCPIKVLAELGYLRGR